MVFERQMRADLSRLPKAGLIEYRTMQLLEREGIAPSVLDFAVENHRCEFRTPVESVVLEYAALTGGRSHYIYPQHQLVQRLCESVTEAGGEVRFGQAVRAVRHADDGVVLSVDGPDGDRSEIECEVAVGCEGSKSPVAAAMSQARVGEQSLPVRLLGILAAAGKAHHLCRASAGFAGQMRRGPDQTQYFLEVPAPTPSPTGPASGPARNYRPALVLPGGWTMRRWASSALWTCGCG